MASKSTNPSNRPISAQGGMWNDGGASRNGGYCPTSLTPTTAEQDANEMWDIYLDEVKEDDKRISDAWKEGSTGILIFVSPNLLAWFVSMTSSKTGLFAATVGAFILEFYKTLSPDSGNQTVALLGQISQQFSNFPNSTHSITATPPFSPSASMIWVNSMWLISLVLSLTSALIATLLQQWARRYVETPHRPNEPNQRARVRSFLFHGTELYRMRLAVQLAPTLLHLSVYLFFAGLVVLFHTINKNVAIAVDVSVGVFAVAYIVLSILPCLDVSCPYRTPMSSTLWYLLHAIHFFAALCLHWLLGLLHGCLVQPDLDYAPRQRILIGWLDSREKAIWMHRQFLKDGLGGSIINRAIYMQDGDRKTVTRLFSLLARGDKSKLQKFAASIPRDRVSELIPLIESGRIVLRDYFLTLFRSCAAGTRVSESDEDTIVRKRSLLVCLDAIHYIAKDPSVPDLNFVLAKIANIGLMRLLWNDSDTAIRFTSRSICALLAKQVVRGALEEPQLFWLCEVTGEAPGAIYNADLVMRDRMNLKSFLYGVFSDQVDDLPTESFKETMAILLDVGKEAQFDTRNSQNRLSEEVGWILQQDPQGSREIVDQLYLIFPYFSPPPPLPPAPGFPSHYSVPLVDPHSYSVVPPSDVKASFPTPQVTHSHASNVPRGEKVLSPPAPPAPPAPPSFPSHYDAPFEGSHLAHYHSTIPLPDSGIPFPSQSTQSHASNVPLESNVQSPQSLPPRSVSSASSIPGTMYLPGTSGPSGGHV